PLHQWDRCRPPPPVDIGPSEGTSGGTSRAACRGDAASNSARTVAIASRALLGALWMLPSSPVAAVPSSHPADPRLTRFRSANQASLLGSRAYRVVRPQRTQTGATSATHSSFLPQKPLCSLPRLLTLLSASLVALSWKRSLSSGIVSRVEPSHAAQATI